MTAAENTSLSYTYGLTLEAGIQTAMQRTHDQLLELIGTSGDQPLTPVRWRFVRGRYDILAWLHGCPWSGVDTLTAPPGVTPEVCDAVMTSFREQARALIREHGDHVVVVVAECLVRTS